MLTCLFFFKNIFFKKYLIHLINIFVKIYPGRKTRWVHHNMSFSLVGEYLVRENFQRGSKEKTDDRKEKTSQLLPVHCERT